MGLLSFLSRNSRDKQGGNVKSQAYHATVQALPPMRGTYPVAGNGRSVFETLQRPNGTMSETHLAGVAVVSDSPAQPPSRFRSSSVERPTTAPNKAVLLANGERKANGRPRTDSPRRPPVSLKRSRLEGLQSSSHQQLNHLHHHAKVESEPQITYQPSPVVDPLTAAGNLAHTRHISVMTMGNGAKGFIDILDAQSEIKPSNFKSRVVAAGVRDYGEDVADRNIGVNGLDLTSAPVQAFYATGSEPQTDKRASILTITPATFANTAATKMEAVPALRKSRDDEELYLPLRKRGGFDAADMALRTRSLNSASFNSFPRRVATGLAPRESGAAPPKKADQQHGVPPPADIRGRQPSSHSHAASAATILATQGRGRTRPYSLYQNSLRGLADVPPMPRLQPDRPQTSYDARGNELGIFGQKGSSNPPPVQKPSGELKLSKTRNPTVGLALTHERVQSIERPQTARPRTAMAESNRTSMASSATFTFPNKGTPKRHSLTSTTGYDFEKSHGDWPFQSRRVERDGQGEADESGFAGRLDVEPFTNEPGLASPAPSPHVLRSGHARSDSREEYTPNYARTRSLVSTSGRSRLDEIYEHIPMRTSSLRHWSLSSSTAPSSTSSNPFGGRPQSSHTANTSVDLAKFSSIMTSSRSSLESSRCAGSMAMMYGTGAGRPSSSGAATNSLDSRMQQQLNSPLASAGISATGGFNIDDYLSSDDDIDADSFIAPRKPKDVASPEDESLLFNDSGYGGAGVPQLPGLFDALVEPPASPLAKAQHGSLRHSFSGSGLGRPRHGRSRSTGSIARSFAPGYDYDEEGLSSDDDYDTESQLDLLPGRRGMKRLSALGTLYGRIEEESLEKVDVRTAIRLRKEAKARKRARTRKAKGKAIEVVDLDEEHLADVEY